MNCAQAEELLGAYAVDALPDDEAADFRAHIATCAEHAEKARAMRAFAATLALSIEPADPPVALRARVLDAIAREPQLSVAATAPHPQPLPAGREGRSVGRPSPAVGAAQQRLQWGPLRNLRPMQAWGALAAAVIAGLLAWNIVLQTGGESDAERFAVGNADAISTLVADGDAPVGAVFYFEDERKAVVIADGVPQLDASQTYQMWAIADGVPSSIGLMAPDDGGRAHSIVAFDASSADVFAVTVEPAGGSDQPTSDPVYTASIRS